jgi:hypothetical protein
VIYGGAKAFLILLNFTTMKNVLLVVLIFFILFTGKVYSQEVITEKLLFKTDERIPSWKKSKVYSIKDQGFIVFNKYSSIETVIMYDFDFNLKWKHAKEELMLSSSYYDLHTQCYFIGDAENVYSIQIFPYGDNKIVICNINKSGEITKKVSALGGSVNTPLSAYILDGKLIILTLFRENNRNEIAMHTVNPDLSTSSKTINFPYDAFELDENTRVPAGVGFVDHAFNCMWFPRGVINDKLVFVKAYVKGKTKEEQILVFKTIEMDSEGNLLNEYTYNFTNTSGETLKEVFVESIIDSEKYELYIIGNLGRVNNASTSIEGFFVCKYKFKGESVYSNFSISTALQSKYQILASSYKPKDIYLDKYNDNLVLFSYHDWLGNVKLVDNVFSFSHTGEIAKILRIQHSTYTQTANKFYTFQSVPIVVLTGVKLQSNIFTDNSVKFKPNSLDFTCKFLAEDYENIIYYEYWDNFSDAAKNKEHCYLFKFDAGLKEMKAYKLKR